MSGIPSSAIAVPWRSPAREGCSRLPGQHARVLHPRRTPTLVTFDEPSAARGRAPRAIGNRSRNPLDRSVLSLAPQSLHLGTAVATRRDDVAHKDLMLAARTSPAPPAWSTRPRYGAHLRPRVARGARSCGRLALLVGLAGCGVAPSVNILGSFFPAWLLSIVARGVLTIITLQVFVAMEIASDIGPTAVVYPCLAGLWTFATWLLVFGG